MLVTRNSITEKKNISSIYWLAALHETPSTANRYTKWTSNQCSNRLKTDHKQIYVHLIYVFADQISCRSIRFTLVVHKSTLVPEIFQLKVSSSREGSEQSANPTSSLGRFAREKRPGDEVASNRRKKSKKQWQELKSCPFHNTTGRPHKLSDLRNVWNQFSGNLWECRCSYYRKWMWWIFIYKIKVNTFLPQMLSIVVLAAETANNNSEGKRRMLMS